MATQPVRMLLVGAGFMGKTHLEAARQYRSVRFVGVADPMADRAEALAAEFGLKAFGGLESALDGLTPEAVDLCTPTPTHLPLIRRCAARGVHVLCEKPITLTLRDAREVGRLGRRIRVMVAQVLRFWPEYEYALQVCRKATYGRVLSVACRRLSSKPAWNNWMTRAAIGGGAVIDLQIHDLDFALQLLGRPKAIQAWGRNTEGGINSVRNQLLYRSGIPVTTQASSVMPVSYPFRMYFSIELEGAVLEMDFWRPKGERLKVFPKHGKAFSPRLPAVDPYGAEIDYFARCLQTGEPFNRVPLKESIEALELCLASARACRLGAVVRL